jgi:protein-S-isoprenylcysteine O-methyltransferase Ste14
MFLRALAAFLVLPGLFAFVLPIAWLVAGAHTRIVRPFGLVPLLLGIVGLLWCVRDFYVRGKGTLAPWSPPERLVVLGLYRWSRNPMYVSVILILIGWSWAFSVPGLFVYAAVLATCFHLRVVMGEEPWLGRTHGAEWEDYSRRVPRWIW